MVSAGYGGPHLIRGETVWQTKSPLLAADLGPWTSVLTRLSVLILDPCKVSPHAARHVGQDGLSGPRCRRRRGWHWDVGLSTITVDSPERAGSVALKALSAALVGSTEDNPATSRTDGTGWKVGNES
jgi:hypothetical protein